MDAGKPKENDWTEAKLTVSSLLNLSNDTKNSELQAVWNQTLEIATDYYRNDAT